MAPNRHRATEDSRSESSNNVVRNITSGGVQSAAKGKRGANNTAAAAGGSSLKDVVSANDGAANSQGSDSGFGGINWPSVNNNTLNAYRHAYRLQTPSSFASLYDQTFLQHPRGVGRHAPSMIRPRGQRRIPKDQLAMAVRKDFNAAAVNEAEVVTNFLYAVKNQNKHFRMRFPPPKK